MTDKQIDTVTISLSRYEEIESQLEALKTNGFFVTTHCDWGLAPFFVPIKRVHVHTRDEAIAAAIEFGNESIKHAIETDKKLNRIPLFIRKIFGAI